MDAKKFLDGYAYAYGRQMSRKDLTDRLDADLVQEFFDNMLESMIQDGPINIGDLDKDSRKE